MGDPETSVPSSVEFAIYIDPLHVTRKIYLQNDLHTTDSVKVLAKVLEAAPKYGDTFRAEHFSRSLFGEEGIAYSGDIMSHNDLITAMGKKFGLHCERAADGLIELDITNAEGIGEDTRDYLQVEISFCGNHDLDEIALYANQVLALTREAAVVANDKLPIKLNLLRMKRSGPGEVFGERFFSKFIGRQEITADLIDSYTNPKKQPSFIEKMKKLRKRKGLNEVRELENEILYAIFAE